MVHLARNALFVERKCALSLLCCTQVSQADVKLFFESLCGEVLIIAFIVFDVDINEKTELLRLSNLYLFFVAGFLRACVAPLYMSLQKI